MIRIKDETFTEILLAIKDYTLTFDNDGCACGGFELKLDENLYIYTYRSCRKSSGCPDEKLWHIHDFQFYPKSQDDLEDGSDALLAAPESINVQLNVEQRSMLMETLRKVSREIWGVEYRNEY